MIHILLDQPDLSGEIYVPIMPHWSTVLFQILSLGFAVGRAWMSLQIGKRCMLREVTKVLKAMYDKYHTSK